jgi:hypothetical protein
MNLEEEDIVIINSCWPTQRSTPLELALFLDALADRTPMGALLRAGLHDLVMRLLPLAEIRAKA